MWHMYWKEKRKGENFYSHIPCEMWRSSVVSVTFSYLFLLTHPVWDVTPTLHKQISDLLYFYSHIPCGMWRPSVAVVCRIKYFYSHIPCGMWQSLYALFCFCKNFYSHIPCGMWPKRAESERIIMIFLLTHPVWDVTEMLRQLGLEQKYFYSHIPCGMWRYCFFNILSTCSNFYSHIPCGMWL